MGPCCLFSSKDKQLIFTNTRYGYSLKSIPVWEICKVQELGREHPRKIWREEGNDVN